MKKDILLILLLFLFPLEINAKENVQFADCVDGDTAKVIYNDEKITIRFLAIDTPESVHPTKAEEPFGKEASEYTCNLLKKAELIEIEFDSNSLKQDKYNRYLVWIFVDDKLLQSELVKKGYAKVAYLYENYKYTDELQKQEIKTKESKLRIWSNYENNYGIIYYIILIAVTTIMIFNKKIESVNKSV